jgi:hypothetical protein
VTKHLYIDDIGSPYAIGGTTFARRTFSLTEKLTGEIWIDGQSIYRRVFTGTITAAAGSRHVVSLTTGVSRIIRLGGWAMSDRGTVVPVIVGDSNNYPFSYVRLVEGELSFQSCYDNARTDDPYEIWVEYTKV